MKKLWKRNAVVAAILVFVCAAIFFNGRYASEMEKNSKVLGQSTLVDATSGETTEVSASAEGDYFAAARLTRQQARDSALSLLQEARDNENVDEAVVTEANSWWK